MKIVIINASQRGKNGNTQILIERLCVGIKRAKAEYEYVNLNEENIEFCKACDKCHEVGHCIINDDMEKIFGMISAADLIIYAFPIYSFHFPAKLKAIFERMYSLGDNQELTVSENGLVFHQINRKICGKPYAVLAHYGNIEYSAVKSSIEYFGSFSRFTDSENIGVLQRNTMRLLSKSIDSGKKSARTEAILRAYEQAGYEIGTSGKITGKTQKAANRELVPIPFIGLLKHSKNKWFKSMLVKVAKKK